MQQTICARNVNAYVHSTTFPESNEQCKNVKEHFCSSTLRYRYCYARPSASILYFYPWVAWFRRLRVPSITSIFSVFVLWPAFSQHGRAFWPKTKRCRRPHTMGHRTSSALTDVPSEVLTHCGIVI